MSTDDSSIRSRMAKRSEMKRVTFRLPPDQYEDIEDVVESGEYPNRSELLREAVRDKLNGGDGR